MNYFIVSYLSTGPQGGKVINSICFEEEKPFFSKKELEESAAEEGESDPVVIAVTRLTKEEYEAYTAE